ncbi:MAG: DUF4173 domain-containing protein [Candidatus Moraniibacteriota bacterium]|nr:MAG: DUF4173 domain-containing protein [Candidatus Moranbacteria bacterium]
MKNKLVKIIIGDDYIGFSTGRGILLSVLFVIFINLFLFKPFWSSGIATLLVGLWIYTYLLLGNKTKHVYKIVSGTGIVVILASISILFVTDTIKTSLLCLVSVSSTFILYYSGLIERSFGGIFELMMIVPRLFGGYIMGIINVVSTSILSIVGGSGKVKSVGQAGSDRALLIGVVLGVPIIVVLTSLLTQGDPVFADYVHRLLKFEFEGETIARIMISSILFVLLIPVVFAEIKRRFVSPVVMLAKITWTSEVSVVVAMVVVVLGVFLAVQWPYVFANVAKETDLSRFGVATYSEYVTRGFGELLAVVGLLWVVSWMAILTYKYTSVRMQKVLQTLHVVLGFELLVFIVSIFRRVWLYQQYHGQTLSRIYGVAFLIWLTGMLIWQALRYVRRSGLATVEVVWSLIVIFGVIWLKPERIVINNPPTVNGRVDYLYMSKLGFDGYEAIKSSYMWATKTLDEITQKKEVIKLEQRREVWYASWIISNLSFYYINKNNSGENGIWASNYVAKAYMQRMQSELPHAELEKYMVMSRGLIERIQRQPASERNTDFDRDTSGQIINY